MIRPPFPAVRSGCSVDLGAGGVFHHGGTVARVPGPDPDRINQRPRFAGGGNGEVGGVHGRGSPKWPARGRDGAATMRIPVTVSGLMAMTLSSVPASMVCSVILYRD